MVWIKESNKPAYDMKCPKCQSVDICKGSLYPKELGTRWVCKDCYTDWIIDAK